MNQAFFIDRDGVINTESTCLWQAEKTILIPGAAEAIRLARSAGRLAVCISNQPWVERQVCSYEDQWRVFARLQTLLHEEGTRLDGFYFCPHTPDKTPCQCRKPFPGLILTAARDLGIDVGGSFMVGDRFTDLEAGRRAGCRDIALVRTGCGAAQLAAATGFTGEFIVGDDLLDAVRQLLEKYEK